jgi:hypothetical protein|tara:strand:- start:115 stop:234 length:120 start_codon:yes stop_codon:yes gene_type:complete
MLEQAAAALAILIITPGWAVAIIAVAYWLWRRLNPSVKE